MKTWGTVVLSGALLALAWRAGRADDADPEPPPPLKVSEAKGVTVKVKAGAGGPLLVADGKGKEMVKGAQSFSLELAEKNAPAKITLRVEGIDRIGRFYLTGKEVKSERFLVWIAGQGKQTFHFDANGSQLKDEKGARLSFTYVPGKGQVEVVMVRHKGMSWPKAPMRVYWSQTIGKKKG